MATSVSQRRPCPVRAGLGALVLAAVLAVTALPHQAAAQPTDFDTWMPRAAQGDPEAQCQVGVAYLNGKNVAQDFAQGLIWLGRASDAGYPYARYVLADVYSRGYAGVPINDEKAYYYAVLAAASATLPDRFRERSIKIRDASAKKLTPAQVTRVQAMTAQAPLNGMAGS